MGSSQQPWPHHHLLSAHPRCCYPLKESIQCRSCGTTFWVLECHPAAPSSFLPQTIARSTYTGQAQKVPVAAWLPGRPLLRVTHCTCRALFPNFVSIPRHLTDRPSHPSVSSISSQNSFPPSSGCCPEDTLKGAALSLSPIRSPSVLCPATTKEHSSTYLKLYVPLYFLCVCVSLSACLCMCYFVTAIRKATNVFYASSLPLPWNVNNEGRSSTGHLGPRGDREAGS